MTACENTARSYLSDRFTHALAGEAMRPVDDPGRLAQALANWDIQTHRALARHLEPSNIVLITRTQGLITGASMVLVDCGRVPGMLERSDRLVPAIAEAGRSWSNLASRWGDLAPPAPASSRWLARPRRSAPPTRQITHDTTTLASPTSSPHVQDSREPCPRPSAPSRRIGAAVVAEKADNPNLTGPARALAASPQRHRGRPGHPTD